MKQMKFGDCLTQPVTNTKIISVLKNKEVKWDVIIFNTMQGKIIIATQLVQSNQVSPYTCALCSIMLWATYKCIV